MAKIRIKSEKPTPLGGIFTMMKQLNRQRLIGFVLQIKKNENEYEKFSKRQNNIKKYSLTLPSVSCALANLRGETCFA